MYLPNPQHEKNMTQGQFISEVWIGKVKEPSLPYYFTYSWSENS